MELVLVAHRCRATLEVADVRPLLGDDQGPLELAGPRGVDTEVGGQLHRAVHALGDEAERPVGEHRRVEGGEEVVPVGHHRPQVGTYQVRMVLHRLGERTEDDADLGQLLLEGRGHRHRVDDGVDRHTAEPLLLGQGDTELVEHGPNLGVDLVEAGQLRLRLRGRVVDDVLVVDRPVVDVLPVRLLQRDPVPVGPQTPLDQPVRLPLLRRDQPDDILAQPLRDRVGVEIGEKPYRYSWLASSATSLDTRSSRTARSYLTGRLEGAHGRLLVDGAVYADRLGFMITQVDPILQVLPCKSHIICHLPGMIVVVERAPGTLIELTAAQRQHPSRREEAGGSVGRRPRRRGGDHAERRPPATGRPAIGRACRHSPATRAARTTRAARRPLPQHPSGRGPVRPSDR